MAVNLNHISDDEESEWLENIHPRLLDESNEEKQLEDLEISSFIEENRNRNTTTRQFRSASHTSVAHSP